MTDAIKTRLIGTVNGHDLHEGFLSLYATLPGSKDIVGRAWPLTVPPADGDDNWFCNLAGQDPVRVESRDAAIAHITGGAA